jgi:hypothetical protein
MDIIWSNVNIHDEPHNMYNMQDRYKARDTRSSDSVTDFLLRHFGFSLTDCFLWGFLLDRLPLTSIFSVHSVFSSKCLFHQNHVHSSVVRGLDSGLNGCADLQTYNLLPLRDQSEKTRIIASMVSSQKNS